jgi:hypothetical protein
VRFWFAPFFVSQFSRTCILQSVFRSIIYSKIPTTMKIAAGVLLAFATFAAAADMDVQIDVTCKGIQMDTLSLEDEMLVGYALGK